MVLRLMKSELTAFTPLNQTILQLQLLPVLQFFKIKLRFWHRLPPEIFSMRKTKVHHGFCQICIFLKADIFAHFPRLQQKFRIIKFLFRKDFMKILLEIFQASSALIICFPQEIQILLFRVITIQIQNFKKFFQVLKLYYRT